MAHLPEMWLAAPVLILLTILPQQRAQVDAVVSFVMQREHIAGLSLAISRHGKLLYARGYGERDLSQHTATDAYTVFPVGSILKQFIAAIILREFAQRHISLLTPISRWFPTFTWGDRISIRDLLAQQSGIASYTESPVGWEMLPLDFSPQSSWEYSNTNYLLLGEILDRVTGEPWQSAVRKIASQEQLFSTHTYWDPNARNRATGYSWTTLGWRRQIPRAHEFSLIAAAGALESNAIDLTTWLSALCRGDILSSGQLHRMFLNRPLLDGRSTNYGYGLFVRRWSNLTVIEHKGNLDGFSADDALVPSNGVSVAVLTNENAIDLVPLTHSIVDMYAEPRSDVQACVAQ